LRSDQRRLLLNPTHLIGDDGDWRYDRLSDADKAVWRRTRGQTTDEASRHAWVERLARGVKSGLITEQEARIATERVSHERRAG
jgi:hypothetical protein